MAVDLLVGCYREEMEDSAAAEAAPAEIQSMGSLFRLLSERKTEVAEMETVNDFRKMISLAGRARTGHARFRRAPLAPVASMEEGELLRRGLFRVYCPTPLRQIPPPMEETAPAAPAAGFTPFTPPPFSAANSLASSVTGEGEKESAFQIVNLSEGRLPPPFSTSSSKRAGGGTTGGRCHCSKRRKSRVKRTVRVPAISLKMADIPPDDFSWRKYGQKPIKGSPHPRGYYKCSSVRGCPARKHVERAVDDPAMLIVTYEGEHNHGLSPPDPPGGPAARALADEGERDRSRAVSEGGGLVADAP